MGLNESYSGWLAVFYVIILLAPFYSYIIMQNALNGAVVLGAGIFSGTFLGMLCYQFWHWIFWYWEGGYSGYKKEYFTSVGIKKGRPNIRYIMDLIKEQHETNKIDLDELCSKFSVQRKEISNRDLLQLSHRIYDKFLYENAKKEVQEYIRRHWGIIHFRSVCVYSVPLVALILSIIFFGTLTSVIGPPSLWPSSLYSFSIWLSIPVLSYFSYAGLKDVRSELDQFEALLVLENRTNISKMIKSLGTHE